MGLRFACFRVCALNTVLTMDLSEWNSGWFVQKIHEFHCLGFQPCHHAIDAADEEIIGEKGYDADYETRNSSHQGLIYTA